MARKKVVLESTQKNEKQLNKMNEKLSRVNEELKKEKQEKKSALSNLHCLCCGKELDKDEPIYKNSSIIYKDKGRLPYCKECVIKIFNSYVEDYKKQKCVNPYNRAVHRFCMAFDYYYNEDVYENAANEMSQRTGFDETDGEHSLIVFYLRQMNLTQYRRKNYNTYLKEQLEDAKKQAKENQESMINIEDDKRRFDLISKASLFFGTGFSSDDYVYLQEQYEDWTTRHECQTKSQEEVFKQICFTQLNILKAQRMGTDTKALQETLLKQMDAAKLQPKQNKGEAISDAQTFGTLIEKWETTKPIPEPEDDLKDIDKLGLLLDVFFRGHLAKFMGLKNGLSNLYDKYMKKYTVRKPEYKDEENNEILFDAIFGSSSLMDEE